MKLKFLELESLNKQQTEEQAKKILEDKGGIEIEGELCLESENYKEAKLVGVLQPQAKERKV